ncbi:MAG: hypothetical protein IKC37_00750 [Clostridia bacterium]|nr:hypothetical protein [Clostridia bacterium]
MLIQCPKCGKPVSDQAEECIHCKYQLNALAPKTDVAQEEKSTQPLVDYDGLSLKEKRAVIDRFCTEYPEHFTAIHRDRIAWTGMLVAFLLFLPAAIMLICIFSGFLAEYWRLSFLLKVGLIFVMAVSLILLIVFGVLVGRNKTKAEEAYACFMQWGKTQNMVNVSPPIYADLKEKKNKGA